MFCMNWKETDHIIIWIAEDQAPAELEQEQVRVYLPDLTSL